MNQEITSKLTQARRNCANPKNISDLWAAATLFEDAINNGYEKIRIELFDVLWRIGTKQSYKRMIEIIEPLIQKGDPSSLIRLGRAYRDGAGVKRDFALAINYMYLAIQQSAEYYNWPIELFDVLIEDHKYQEAYTLCKKYWKIPEISAKIGSLLYNSYCVGEDYDKYFNYCKRTYPNFDENKYKSLYSHNKLDNSKQNHFWAIITGSINVKLEFYLTLDWLIKKRNCGQLSGIIFSTWKNHIDSIDDLRTMLEKNGIILVENDNPVNTASEVIGKSSRQIQDYQLVNALKIIPDNSLVLKCRTDLTTYKIIENEEVIFSNKYLDANVDWGTCSQKKKIITEWNALTLIPPFKFGDPFFVGQKEDLLKVVKFNNVELSKYDFSSDDKLFLVHSEFPIITTVMRYIDLRALTRYRLSNKEVTLPKILNQFYALYFVILKKCYYIKENDACK